MNTRYKIPDSELKEMTDYFKTSHVRYNLENVDISEIKGNSAKAAATILYQKLNVEHELKFIEIQMRDHLPILFIKVNGEWKISEFGEGHSENAPIVDDPTIYE